jgi:hypothetical protein
MLQLGNLAVVAAKYKNCSLQIYNEEVTVCVGEGIDRRVYSCAYNDDEYINKIIAHLNFGTEIDEHEGCLVCKKCGYKQYDDETVSAFRKKFPNTETHDIPYYCGACMDNVDTEEYEFMQEQMKS